MRDTLGMLYVVVCSKVTAVLGGLIYSIVKVMRGITWFNVPHVGSSMADRYLADNPEPAEVKHVGAADFVSHCRVACLLLAELSVTRPKWSEKKRVAWVKSVMEALRATTMPARHEGRINPSDAEVGVVIEMTVREPGVKWLAHLFVVTHPLHDSHEWSVNNYNQLRWELRQMGLDTIEKPLFDAPWRDNRSWVGRLRWVRDGLTPGI